MSIDLTLKVNNKFTILSVSNEDYSSFTANELIDTVKMILEDPEIDDEQVTAFRQTAFSNIYCEFLTEAASRCTKAVSNVDKLIKDLQITSRGNSSIYSGVKFDNETEILAFSLVKYKENIVQK